MNTVNTNQKWRISGFFALCLTAVTQPASAVPFGIFDARSMAMGGVGVASGSQAASFNNPALLTTADETHEWSAFIPTVGKQIMDPAKVDDSLAAFQKAAGTLDNANTPANQAAVQQQLDSLNGNHYSTNGNAALMLAIPSRIISGAAFFNVYGASTAQPVIGGDDLTATPPSYASTLDQRGIRVVENGVTTGKILEAGTGWTSNMAVGVNAKFILVEGYGYTESLRTADTEIKRSNSNSGSQFTFDVGILKEIGVWKIGLVAKNILPGSYKYGNSGDKFKIETQLRAGFAYQSRRSVIELDIDLLENDPVGFDLPSQVAALGWEWRAWKWLKLRAGYNQNLAGNEAAYGAAGFGITFSTIQVDVAAFSGDEGEGASAQLVLQF